MSPKYQRFSRYWPAKPGKEIFDCVLLCNGHHATPHFPPKWPGQDKFKGKITHAHSYKEPRGYEDTNVVVVGMGNSALDLAVEISKVAKQVRNVGLKSRAT